MRKGLLYVTTAMIVLTAFDFGSAAPPRAAARLTEAQVDARLAKLRGLCQKNLRKEVVEQFGDEDIAAWLNASRDRSAMVGKAVDALNLRGTSLAFTGDYERAEKDFTFALKLSPSNGYLWNSLGGVYRGKKEDDKALNAFKKAVECDLVAHKGRKSHSWMPISSTLEAASILTNRTDYPEALKVLQHYNAEDIQEMSPSWACRMLRAYGQVYLATGREKEAMSVFKVALEIEMKQEK